MSEGGEVKLGNTAQRRSHTQEVRKDEEKRKT